MGFARAFCDEILRWPRSVMFWWLMAAAPIGAMLVLTGLFQDGQMRELPVASCDLDNSAESRSFIRSADAASTIRIAYEVQSEEEGLSLLRRGAVYGVIIMPRNFGRDAISGHGARAIVYADGQRMPVGSMIRRDLTALSGAFWQKIYVDALMRQGIPKNTAMAMA
ncbi:MAG: ABC transporter permease, partial [Succinivibrio sp.]